MPRQRRQPSIDAQSDDGKAAAYSAASRKQEKDAKEEKQQAQQAQQKQEKRKGWSWSDIGTNLFMLIMLGYAIMVARNIYGIFEPDFPDTYPNGQPMPKFKNAVEPGTLLHARVWCGPAVPTSASRRPHSPPDWEFDFVYGYTHGFESQSKTVAVTIPEGLLDRQSNVHIYAEVVPLSATGDYEKARAVASATGGFIKYTTPPVLIPKYNLLSGQVRKSCSAAALQLLTHELANAAAVRSAKSTLRRCTANGDRWRAACRSCRFGCEEVMLRSPLPVASQSAEMNAQPRLL